MNETQNGRPPTTQTRKPWGESRLGGVPKRWETRRLKGVCLFEYGDSLAENYRTNTGVPVYGSNGLIGHTLAPNTERECLIIGRKGSSGKVLYSEESAFAIDTTFFVDRRHTRANIRWLYYLLTCLNLESLSGDVGVPGLNRARAYQQACSYPPLDEQAAIVRYLDHADEQIQHYIAAKERLIALLQEQRQALVHQAVTWGLDPNVRLKPSGVDWIGDLPEHWELCRLRNVVSEVTTGSRGWSSYASDTGPLFIRIANLNRGSLKLRFDNVVRLNLPRTSEATRARIRAGDLLVSVTAYIGSVGVAPKEFEEAYVSQHVARCQPRPGLSSEWLGYVLLSIVGQAHGQISLYGGTKDGLSLDDVKNYPILLPPAAEQTTIVEYINSASADIVVAINHARRQIDFMNEYRTRLIADVVTGQLDVRDTAAQLSETPLEDGLPTAT